MILNHRCHVIYFKTENPPIHQWYNIANSSIIINNYIIMTLSVDSVLHYCYITSPWKSMSIFLLKFLSIGPQNHIQYRYVDLSSACFECFKWVSLCVEHNVFKKSRATHVFVRHFLFLHMQISNCVTQSFYLFKSENYFMQTVYSKDCNILFPISMNFWHVNKMVRQSLHVTRTAKSGHMFTQNMGKLWKFNLPQLLKCSSCYWNFLLHW